MGTESDVAKSLSSSADDNVETFSGVLQQQQDQDLMNGSSFPVDSSDPSSPKSDDIIDTPLSDQEVLEVAALPVLSQRRVIGPDEPEAIVLARLHSTYKKPSFFSDLFYKWFNRYALFGWYNDFEIKDLGPFNPGLDSRVLTSRFRHMWEKVEVKEAIKGSSGTATRIITCQEAKCKEPHCERRHFTPGDQSHGGSLALVKVIFKLSVHSFLHSFIFDLLSEVGNQTSPLLISAILQVLEDSELTNDNGVKTSRPLTDDEFWKAIGFCVIIFFVQMFKALAANRSYWITQKNGMRTKVGLVGMIFDKSLSLTSEARQDYSLGRSVALISTSVARIDAAFPYLYYLWFGPIQLLVIILMINWYVGWEHTRWIVILLTCILPLQTFLMRKMNSEKKHVAILTDRRLRFLQETIMGMRVVKCYALEPIFMEKLQKLRQQELDAIYRWRLLASISIVINVAAPAFSAVIGFLCMSRSGNMVASKAFTALTYFNMLDLPLSNMPIMTTLTVDAFAGVQRIQDFLRAPSITYNALRDDTMADIVRIEGGSYSWTPLSDAQQLEEENCLGELSTFKSEVHNDATSSTASFKDGAALQSAGESSTSSVNGDDAVVVVDKNQKDSATVVIVDAVADETSASDSAEDVGGVLSSDEAESDSATLIDGGSGLPSSQAVLLGSDVEQLVQYSIPPSVGIQLQHADEAAARANEEDGDHIGLCNININIPRGSLIGVVGSVGSGKSSLLAAIYGEMHQTGGSMHVNGSIGLCPQESWIINANIRENILLGQPFEHDRYWQTIAECQMEDDLESLPYGDMTAIGEGGISLSGGQKARLNLARMVYFNRDICLMDDPLSAVDYRVGKALVDECILGRGVGGHDDEDDDDAKLIEAYGKSSSPPSVGLLANKTRILATHHLGLVYHCDSILVMKDGRIVEHGTYDELMSNGVVFQELIKSYEAANKTAEAAAAQGVPAMIVPVDVSHSSGIVTSPTATDASSLVESPIPSLATTPVMTESTCLLEAEKSAYSSDIKATSEIQDMDSVAVMDAARIRPTLDKMTATEEQLSQVVWRSEELQAKSVDLKIYGIYMAAAGGITALFFVMFMVGFNEVLRTGRDYWITWWVEGKSWFTSKFGFKDTDFENWYVVLAIVQTLATWGTGFVVYRTSYLASRRIHNRALFKIIYSPMRFFETTPVGRIVNRFGRDMDLVDMKTSDDLWWVLFAFGSMFSTLLVIGIQLPSTLIILIFPGALAACLHSIYRCNARQLHRMFAHYFSPIMANFSETYLGMAVARAFGHERYFQQRHDRATNVATHCSYISYALRRWTAVCCEFISAILLSFSGIWCVIRKAPSEDAGLILSSLVNFVFSLDWFIKQSAELEASMVGVQRLHQYVSELVVERGMDHEHGKDLGKDADFDSSNAMTVLKQRRAAKTAADKHNVDLEKNVVDSISKMSAPQYTAAELQNWPSTGKVQFINSYLVYRSGTKPVLKDLNLTIRTGERVGIVGRTGAGKSSIMTALMRTVELSGGSILVDGVDIAQVPLSILRSRVTIVPQDPVMFAGSLSFNLDPHGRHTEEELWSALEKVGLRKMVSKLKRKLQFEVSDFGDNFSLGQRQLICLARAMLCDSRIVLMDEATASMDSETDARIQRSLRTNFGGCTIITIAHRLGTIRDYDRVVVMDFGRIVECDAPEKLLANPKSRLSHLFRSHLQKKSSADKQ